MYTDLWKSVWNNLHRVTSTGTIAVAAMIGATYPAAAQQTFSLQQGQVLSITPEGKVEYAPMQGNPAHVLEMERRSQPVSKGLVVWAGPDGKLRYLTEPLGH
jgi:hypothetical protein